MRELKFEIWKPVEGHEETYEVSDLGRVRSLDRLDSRGFRRKGIMLSQHLNHKGYIMIRLHKDGKSLTTFLHRLIAQGFIPNPDNKPQVNHLNGIKNDNRVRNLEWSTESENQTHAYNTGLKKGMAGERNGRSILSRGTVDLIKSKYNLGEKASDISNELSINLSSVRSILSNKTWKETAVNIEKRDDRSNWSKDHSKNSLMSRFNNDNASFVSIVQYTEDKKEIGRFRSINSAALKTGIPRKSIEAVVNRKKFYSNDKTKYWIMDKAGSFYWKKIDLTTEQFKQLL